MQTAETFILGFLLQLVLVPLVSFNHYFFVRRKVDQRAGQLSIIVLLQMHYLVVV